MGKCSQWNVSLKKRTQNHMHITIPVLLNVNINQMPGDDSKTFVGHKHFFPSYQKYRTPTEQLLNAGRRPQTSQKTRNSPCTR